MATSCYFSQNSIGFINPENEQSTVIVARRPNAHLAQNHAAARSAAKSLQRPLIA
jgi:hypothetical protein